jgi:hypothetical protein
MSQTKAQLISDLVQALNFTGTSSAPANGMYLSAANTIKLATNSNGRLTIDSSGNAVFTGTCTATTFIGALTGNASGSAATVTGAAQTAITSVGTLTGLTVTGDVLFDNGTNSGKDILFDASANKLEFSDDVIASFGNSGDLQINHVNAESANYITSKNNVLYICGKTGQTAIQIVPDAATDLRYAGGQKLVTTSLGARVVGDLQMGNTAGVRFHHAGTTSIFETQTAADDLLFKTTPSGGSTTERLRIKSDGMVGIGVSNPAVAGAYAGMEIGGTNNTGLRLSTTHASGWAFTDYEINGVQKFIAGCRGGGGTTWRISTGANLDTNVKINVTVDDCTSFGNGDPNAWQTGGGYYNLQIGNAGYMRADTDTSGNFFSYGVNTYRDNTGWKFIEDGRATQISHGTGDNAITFYGSNSGNADGAPTFFEMLKLKVDGDVVCGSGNLVLTDGQGIDFSADAHAGGMTNELLDDYEEGSWTPTMATSGGNLTATYTVQTGTYTKIGRMVYVVFDMTVSNTPTGSNGYPQVRGLPFTPWVGQNNAAGGGFPIPQFRDSGAMPVDARLYNCSYGHSSDDAIWIQYFNSSGTIQQPAGGTWWSSGRCQGEMVYQTTA